MVHRLDHRATSGGRHRRVIDVTSLPSLLLLLLLPLLDDDDDDEQWRPLIRSHTHIVLTSVFRVNLSLLRPFERKGFSVKFYELDALLDTLHTRLHLFCVTTTPEKEGASHSLLRWLSDASAPITLIVSNNFIAPSFPSTALTLMVGRREGHPVCEKFSVGLLVVTI